MIYDISYDSIETFENTNILDFGKLMEILLQINYQASMNHESHVILKKI